MGPGVVHLFTPKVWYLFYYSWAFLLIQKGGEIGCERQAYLRVVLFIFFFRAVTLNPKGGGGVQNDPMVRRMSVISHMVMLWSQKFLTLSINISTTRY